MNLFASGTKMKNCKNWQGMFLNAISLFEHKPANGEIKQNTFSKRGYS
jgi:hypothetical protein